MTEQLNRIIEGALFAAGEPLTIDRIASLFEENERPEKQEIRAVLESLMKDYEDRGLELKELASGFQFQVRSDLAQWVKRLWDEKPARYSRALLETLALIAYRQPITRGEIEEIRGVTVGSYMIHALLDRDWIRIVGHRDVPGKPSLYATTKHFLDYFGLKSLSELPPLSEMKDIDEAGKAFEEKMMNAGDISEDAVEILDTGVSDEDEMSEDFEDSSEP